MLYDIAKIRFADKPCMYSYVWLKKIWNRRNDTFHGFDLKISVLTVPILFELVRKVRINYIRKVSLDFWLRF